jgi:DNA invertase Pin-like site-specific DNA recombinase
MAHIGYARVSTEEQSLSLQIDSLQKYGCQKILTDHGVSGANFVRPGLKKILNTLWSNPLEVLHH